MGRSSSMTSRPTSARRTTWPRPDRTWCNSLPTSSRRRGSIRHCGRSAGPPRRRPRPRRGVTVMADIPARMSRRTLLKLAATAELGAVLAPRVAAQPADPRPDWPSGVVAYLRAPARPDGGYAWDDLVAGTPDADLRRDRLLPAARPRAAGQGAAGRVHSHPAPGAAQEARTGAPRFRVPADPESPLARRRCLVVPRARPRLDAPAALPPAVRAGQQPRLPVRTRGVHLPRAARPAPGRPRARVHRLPRHPPPPQRQLQ